MSSVRRSLLPPLSATMGQCWTTLSVPTGIDEMLRPHRAALPALMDEQPQSDALSTLLIVCCNACSQLRGCGDQGEKWELGGPQSHITDFPATLKAAEKRKAKKKFQCDRTQGKRHALLSKTQGKCHESAERQWKWKVLPRKPRDASYPVCRGELSILQARDTLFQ